MKGEKSKHLICGNRKNTSQPGTKAIFCAPLQLPFLCDRYLSSWLNVHNTRITSWEYRAILDQQH